MTDKSLMSLIGEFERALGEIRARVCSSPDANTSIAIAFSGGLDSSVLLHLTHDYAERHGVPLFAFHIHHGISPDADDWLANCAQQCAESGITFDARQVELRNKDKTGIEESARISRYAALGDLCRVHRVPLLLTAHHRDDQAETVLLQLLRGSGTAGLSGMDTANTAADLLGDAGLVIGRPLLSHSRRQLEEFASVKQISCINDDSNTDTRFARNALRHEVMPALARHFPGYQERFARSAQHAQSAHRLLQEVAQADLQQCLNGVYLDVSRLRQLNADRIDNLLRHWLGLHGMRMPSTSWLAELRSQLLDAKEDAQLCVTHPDGHVRRYRDRVFLTRRDDADPGTVLPETFCWSGDAEIHFPAYGGTLFFEPMADGISADWLMAQPMVIRYRQGGERLKLAPNRPTRSLKQHCQALDIPAWNRERLPIIMVGKDVLFAAHIGMDCKHVDLESSRSIRLRWQDDI